MHVIWTSYFAKKIQVYAPQNIVGQTLQCIVLKVVFGSMELHDSSGIELVNVAHDIISLLLICFLDVSSSVVKLPRHAYDVTCSTWLM